MMIFLQYLSTNNLVFFAKRIYAQRVQDYSSKKWIRIFESNESIIKRGKGARREYTFNRPSTQIALQDIDAVDCHKGKSQIFWAALSGSSRRTGLSPFLETRIHLIEGLLNG
ncbi:uncharacterized protein N7484_010644 [Penicillium longicatenatum]|uniref:uncharacterized protein n=1 Tax=Penicillium longicatenatum TaxID=1561947 RepID=UPI002546ECBB|nr:uncharacterized protein N7484_010644 [Penicillium longicatenatum]KAJ5630544.1 hypothetical protein N7484_010644 [Penicillium longicatenatum]